MTKQLPILNPILNIKQDMPNLCVSIQNIDSAIMYYIQNQINPTVQYQDSITNVPILYAGAQRWRDIKRFNYLKSDDGKLQSPMITIHRTGQSINKTLLNPKVSLSGHPYILMQRKGINRNSLLNIVQKNKLQNKQYYVIAIPTYLNISYQVNIWCDFVQHINKIKQAFSYHSGLSWGNQYYKFKTSIQQFDNQTEITTETERLVKCTCTLNVVGYILPDIVNKYPSISKQIGITSVNCSTETEIS